MANLIHEMFLSFSFIFIICECGEKVCNAFNEINKEIDKLDWYLFPIEIQRNLPMLIIISQKPVIIQGYGNIWYNREAFKNAALIINSFF